MRVRLYPVATHIHGPGVCGCPNINPLLFAPLLPKLVIGVLGLPLMVEHLGSSERNATNRAFLHHRRSSCPILRSCGTPFRIPADTFEEKNGVGNLVNHTLPGFYIVRRRWRCGPRTHPEY